jgi:TetR/AcrR family transcriptional regulator
VRSLPVAIATSEAVMAETFAQRGFEDTRMEDLAEATGVPKATLCYHFGGKEEILAWLLRSTLAAVGEAVAQAASGPGTARRRLESVVRAQLRVMAERPAACRILIADLGRAARMPDLADGVGRAFHAPVLGPLGRRGDRRVVAQGQRRPQRGVVDLRRRRDPPLDNLIAGGPLKPNRLAPPILRFIFTGLIAR